MRPAWPTGGKYPGFFRGACDRPVAFRLRDTRDPRPRYFTGPMDAFVNGDGAQMVKQTLEVR